MSGLNASCKRLRWLSLPVRCRASRGLLLCLFVITTQLVASEVQADSPRLRCDAVRVGQRVLVRLSLDSFVDRGLARLVRLGLSGTISVEATLLRSRRMWFDDVVDTGSKTVSLGYQRGRGFVLDGRRRVANPAEIELGTLSVGSGQGNARGLYLNITAELQVVTVSSLRRTAGWITRRNDASRSGLVRDRMIDLVVTDLARSATTSCQVRERVRVGR